MNSFYFPLILKSTQCKYHYKNNILLKSPIHNKYKYSHDLYLNGSNFHFCGLLFAVGFILTSLIYQWKRFVGCLFLVNLLVEL